jgi:hypothetical protein
MDAAYRERLPPRVLPWLYFAFGYASLAMAFGAILWDPRGVAGFFYHARMVAIVHLVTLGWITSSILGALYVLGPTVLRTPMPAGWRDACAFASYTIGVIGMIAHFWIGEFGGMAWSGAMVAAGILYVGWRVVTGLRTARVDSAIKWHVALAFANIAGAAAAGVLIGFDKVYHFLPGFVLANVIGHAHLAAIGWASMMVVGVGYRMVPMILPSAMPRGRSMFVSAVLLEAGVVGLFVALVMRSAWTGLFAIVIVAGFAAFAAHAAAMLRHRKTPAPGFTGGAAVRHAAAAMASLAVSAALGVWLAFAAPSEVTLRAALAYGVFGLVGFLAQMAAGMHEHVLRVLAWYSAAHRAWDLDTIRAPDLGSPLTRSLAWLLWVWGVPALAVGFFLNGIPLLTAGAGALEAAVLIGVAHAVRAARRAFAARRRLSCVDDAERRGPAQGKPALQTGHF